MTRKAFEGRALNRYPGDTAIELMADWSCLERGTIVQPSSAGMDNYHGQPTHVRRVNVLTGPHKGERVIGPY